MPNYTDNTFTVRSEQGKDFPFLLSRGTYDYIAANLETKNYFVYNHSSRMEQFGAPHRRAQMPLILSISAANFYSISVGGVR